MPQLQQAQQHNISNTQNWEQQKEQLKNDLKQELRDQINQLNVIKQPKNSNINDINEQMNIARQIAQQSMQLCTPGMMLSNGLIPSFGIERHLEEINMRERGADIEIAKLESKEQKMKNMELEELKKKEAYSKGFDDIQKDLQLSNNTPSDHQQQSDPNSQSQLSLNIHLSPLINKSIRNEIYRMTPAQQLYQLTNCAKSQIKNIIFNQLYQTNEICKQENINTVDSHKAQKQSEIKCNEYINISDPQEEYQFLKMSLIQLQRTKDAINQWDPASEDGKIIPLNQLLQQYPNQQQELKRLFELQQDQENEYNDDNEDDNEDEEDQDDEEGDEIENKQRSTQSINQIHDLQNINNSLRQRMIDLSQLMQINHIPIDAPSYDDGERRASELNWLYENKIQIQNIVKTRNNEIECIKEIVNAARFDDQLNNNMSNVNDFNKEVDLNRANLINSQNIDIQEYNKKENINNIPMNLDNIIEQIQNQNNELLHKCGWTQDNNRINNNQYNYNQEQSYDQFSQEQQNIPILEWGRIIKSNEELQFQVDQLAKMSTSATQDLEREVGILNQKENEYNQILDKLTQELNKAAQTLIQIISEEETQAEQALLLQNSFSEEMALLEKIRQEHFNVIQDIRRMQSRSLQLFESNTSKQSINKVNEDIDIRVVDINKEESRLLREIQLIQDEITQVQIGIDEYNSNQVSQELDECEIQRSGLGLEGLVRKMSSELELWKVKLHT